MTAISLINGEKPAPAPIEEPSPAQPAARSRGQVVVLRVRDNDYALPIGRVQEIVRVPEITPLPEASLCIEGLINLRGRVLPVVDLATRLGFGNTEHDRNARIVVVKTDGEQSYEVGLLVDGVSKVLRLAEEDIEPTSEIAARESHALIVGIAKVEGRLVLLLDLDSTLDKQEVLEAIGR